MFKIKLNYIYLLAFIFISCNQDSKNQLPIYNPVDFNPIMPMNPIQTPPYWYKDDSGTPPPIYCQTSTFDSPFEYSDTKWPKDTKH